MQHLTAEQVQSQTVRNVNPAVRMVRLSVWLMLLLTTSANFSRRSCFRFSAMRSNTDDCVVIRIPNQGQDSGNNCQRNLLVVKRMLQR